MFISKFAINRPVTIMMIYIIIIVMAVYSVLNLPLSLQPNLSYPRLTVITSWSDASPEEVEANITSPIESIGSSIEGVTSIKSTSSRQSSVVNLEFARETDMDFARFELNEKLQLLQDQLPENTNPRIQTYVPREFREEEFLKYGITGPFEANELEEIIENNLIYKISSLEGVSNCRIGGSVSEEIEIRVKNFQLNQFYLYQIRSIVSIHGEKYAVSGFDMQGESLIIQLDDRYSSLEELKKLKLNTPEGNKIDISQVAELYKIKGTTYSYNRYDGMDQLTLTIDKENTANAIKLSAKIKRIIEDSKLILPEGVELVKFDDEAEEIIEDMEVLYQRGLFSILIIFLVLLIFLRHPTSTIMVILSILFSSALTFTCMFFLKIGLNMLSLAGLALGFGMIVDNSIVVYENIFRYQFKGLDKKEAALKGVSEVALPITASTLTTVIVFAPFLYLQGDLKIFYLPFVYSTVLALVSSLLVSFTFIPVVANRFLNLKKVKKVEESYYFNPQLNLYQKVVKFLLRFRWFWLVLVLAFLGFSIRTYTKDVKKGFIFDFPKDDYIGIQISLPVGSNIEQTDNIAKMFEEKVLGKDGVSSVKTQVYTSFAYIRVDFTEEMKKSGVPLIIREKLKAYATNFGNVDVYVHGFGPSFGGGGISTANFSFTIKGYDYEELKGIAEKLETYMYRANRRVQEIDINAVGWWKNEVLYEYQIGFKRDKLINNQVDIYTIISQLFTRIEHQQNAQFATIGKDEYSIYVRDENYKEFSINDLRDLVVANREGRSIKLSEIADISKVGILSEIEREDELYIRRINFDYRGSFKKGKTFLDALLETYPLPTGYNFHLDRNYFGNKSDQQQLNYLLLFAVILVYMALSSLFESFKFPFIILLTIPLAFIGVILMFYFTEETFASSAQIGLVLLVGIVVNNSIIMVDHINLLRKKGLSKIEAVLQGSRDRLRPILMTSLTTIAGLLPMMLKSVAGKNDFWRLLSFSTIGGLIASTFFVLTFIPILYSFFTGMRIKRKPKISS